MSSVPPWLDALRPARQPVLRPMVEGSPELAWHVDVEFEPWLVPPGRSLTGSETWNGKAILVSSTPTLEASVGEVEVAERLRVAFPSRSSYWTAGRGNPPSQWRRWALVPALHEGAPWLADLDRRIRAADDALRDNRRGWPDVLSWESGASDLLCVEYKGPFPKNPDVMDTVSPEQLAWFRSAVRLRLLDADRYAVVTWIPDAGAKVILREQSLARQRPSGPGVPPLPPAAAASRRRSTQPVGASGGSKANAAGGGPAAHGDKRLHRRTIGRELMARTGSRVESHVDGTIDNAVPYTSNPQAFRDIVVEEVRRLGYKPTAVLMPGRSDGPFIRISTPETLAQAGRGAHRES